MSEVQSGSRSDELFRLFSVHFLFPEPEGQADQEVNIHPDKFILAMNLPCAELYLIIGTKTKLSSIYVHLVRRVKLCAMIKRIMKSKNRNVYPIFANYGPEIFSDLKFCPMMETICLYFRL